MMAVSAMADPPHAETAIIKGSSIAFFKFIHVLRVPVRLHRLPSRRLLARAIEQAHRLLAVEEESPAKLVDRSFEPESPVPARVQLRLDVAEFGAPVGLYRPLQRAVPRGSALTICPLIAGPCCDRTKV
jgi:hypothetical protein